MNSQTTNPTALNQLIADIQSPGDAVRGPAWQSAAPFGAPAVKPLAAVMADPDFEIARAAKRALWKIVRHAGRPKAEKERRAVQVELLSLLPTPPVPVRCEIVWMLSEIGDSDAVGPLAAMPTNATVREAARCALERMPTSSATRALKKAFESAPEDFRPALANSLRVRGSKVKPR